MIPSYYEFYNPVKILSGNKSLENLPYEMLQMNLKRSMLITDQGIKDAGLIKILYNSFDGYELPIVEVYDNTPADSSTKTVDEIATIYRKNNCDSIIALGGGSVIDTAKGVNIVVTENKNLCSLAGAEVLTQQMKPLIVIPTTSGTGSEATLVAVIANEEKQTKMLFTSYKILPTLAIIDPRMTITMPPKITAATGMDALTHAIEAYSCLQKNPLSDAYAVSAINLIRKYLVAAVKDGNNIEARVAMANASLMAGIAFSNSMVGIVHSIGHACGAVCHVPHGIAMAIILPLGMKYNMKKCSNYYSELLLPLAGADEYAKTSQDLRAERAIEIIKDLNKNLNILAGVPIKLRDTGVNLKNFEQIANAAINDGANIFNPEEVLYQDVINILSSAF